jgi:hypothetical protein
MRKRSVHPGSLWSAAALGSVLVTVAGSALGGDGPERGPHMAAARPLSRHSALHNPLLSPTAVTSEDQTAISLAPNLSALCQSFIGKPNPYPDPRPNVDEINGDTIVLTGSQTGCSAAQNETTIVVNPENPLNLVSGTNDYRVFNSRENRNDSSGYAYATFDGGQTWTDVQVPHLTFQTGATGALSDMDSAGDPAMAFGPHGRVYYSNLVFSRLNAGGGVVVSASRDGGRTWGEPSIVHLDGVDEDGNPVPTNVLDDKPWIAVDPVSGTVYVTWTQFGPGGSPILVSRSSDRGRHWSKPVAVNPASSFTAGGITPYSQGSIPQVAADGTLYIAYETAVCQSLACDQPTDHDAIVLATSEDGGRNFTNRELAIDYDFPFNADTGAETLTGENFRINSFPQFTIDRVTGHMYITWADDRNGQYDSQGNSIKTNGDVFVIASRDGTEWSSPVQIGTPADEVYPAIAANNGGIAVTFYTRALDPEGIGLDYAAVTGSAEDLGDLADHRLRRLTTATENPQIQFAMIGLKTGNVLQGVFIGDYTAVAMGADGVIHPSWTDFRGNPGVTAPNQDAYTQAFSIEQ